MLPNRPAHKDYGVSVAATQDTAHSLPPNTKLRSQIAETGTASPMCRADPLLDWRRDPGAADRLSALGTLGLRPRHPGGDALLDDRPLELAEHREHAKHRPPGRAGSVKALLVKK